MQNGDLKPPKKNSEGLKLSSRVFGSLKRPFWKMVLTRTIQDPVILGPRSLRGTRESGESLLDSILA